MKKTTYILLLFTLGFMSCKKEKVEVTAPPPVDPKDVITMDRTINYLNSTETKHASYDDKAQMKSESNFSKNRLTLSFFKNATQGAFGDYVSFSIDTTLLKNGLKGVHSLTIRDYPAPVWSTTYMVTYLHADNYEEYRYAVGELGYEVEGRLTIDAYDPARQLISGSYTTLVKRLGFGVYNNFPVLTKEDCTVSLSGTFKNVKVARY